MAFLYTTPTYLTISASILMLLLFATVTNFTFLRLKPRNETLLKAHVIIRSWWAIVLTVLLAGLFGKFGFLLLFFILIFLALREYCRVSELTEFKQILFLFAFAFTCIQTYLLSTLRFELFSSMPLIFFLCTLLVLLFKPSSLEVLPKLIASYIVVLFLAQCILHLPALIFAGPEFFGDFDKTLVVFFLIFGLTQISDILQFIFGKSLGRYKLIPHLSPNKTAAGFIGALISTTLIGGYLFHELVGVDLKAAFGFGFSISLLGMFGDLTFSAIKRYFKIKDFSTLIPGHGGVLDRLDSVVFTCPIMFNIFKFYS